MCLQIREKEANLDLLIMPIDDMYALLARCALWTKTQLSRCQTNIPAQAVCLHVS